MHTRRRLRRIAVWLFLVAAGVAVRVAGDWYPAPALAGLIGVTLVGIVVVLIGRYRANRRMKRWSAEAGWHVIDRNSRDWPWQGLNLNGEALVKRAWTMECDGFPVTAGDVRWSGGAFAGAVLAREGRGIFVVVRLPLPTPGMAMRLPYQFIGDSHRLESLALREAYLKGEIPPWTASGNQLFTVEEHPGWTTPHAIEHAIRRALRVVQLLDLGPDVSNCPTNGLPS
jgi:hypothetical protein